MKEEQEVIGDGGVCACMYVRPVTLSTIQTSVPAPEKSKKVWIELFSLTEIMNS